MKVLAKILSVAAVVTLLAGCCGNDCCKDFVYVPNLPPAAEAKLLDYFEQPGNKVFVVAIDPSGDFSFGYDYGKATVEQAARVAVEKCDVQRDAHGIISKAVVYAINDEVVYENSLRVAHERAAAE